MTLGSFDVKGHTKKVALLYPEECYKINGALYEVHKELGPGLLEKVYQEALEKELKLQGIPFEREKSFTIMYKGRPRIFRSGRRRSPPS